MAISDSLRPQTLLFDADDTLWENNIYFEEAIAAFISLLDHRVHTPEQVREHLNTVERATIAAHGYGLRSFRRSLVTCFEQLTEALVTQETHRRIVLFVDSIADHEIELLPGVDRTLQQLAERHRLLLVTKGDRTEQLDKLERSGLRSCFAEIEVLDEKVETGYRAIVDHHRLNPRDTWMIGNSPKSDINPPLAAGLNAVFIPHGSTWILEHETIATPPTGSVFLQLSGFTDLLQHF